MLSIEERMHLDKRRAILEMVDTMIHIMTLLNIHRNPLGLIHSAGTSLARTISRINQSINSMEETAMAGTQSKVPKNL
jgi:hypothetical protein